MNRPRNTIGGKHLTKKTAEDHQEIVREIARAAFHEAGHAVIISSALGVPAKASIWHDGNGGVEGSTRHPEPADWTPMQWACAGVAGAVGEFLAHWSEHDPLDHLRELHAGMNPGDAKTARVPYHGDQPDWEPTPEFRQAIQTVHKLLKGPLFDEWKAMGLELMATLGVEAA